MTTDPTDPRLIWRERLARAAQPLLPVVTRLSANTWTILALATALAAAACLAGAERRPLLYLAGAGLAGLAGLVDALDGIVARATGSASRWGDFLDHLCDRVADVGMIGGIAVQPQASDRLGLAVMLLVLSHGYVGTQMEASFGMRTYEGTGRGEYVLLGIVGCILLYIEGVTGMLSNFGIRHNAANLVLGAAGLVVSAGLVERLLRARRIAKSMTA